MESGLDNHENHSQDDEAGIHPRPPVQGLVDEEDSEDEKPHLWRE